ncbi:uncharacterized protein [Procambarus clarkii]|uniref:uncharacterized protein isoform X2 n=1 Tax=Procambarus clarkii TaxID=6728 RepID=UPI00374242CA
MATTCSPVRCVALTALVLLGGAGGVRIKELEVPAVALENDDVHLRCDYEDEGGSSLYTLKWYKDGNEFYRHLPSLSPDAPDDRCLHTYPVDGVTVDCWASTEREVVLQGVSRTTSGDYECEVIGEHPKFRKEARKARLTVFSEALQRPVVTGVEDNYRPLDVVNLNCSSANTQYLALISWVVNGRPAPSRGVIHAACVTLLGDQHKRSTEVTLLNPDHLSAQEYYYNAGCERGCGSGWLWCSAFCLLLPCLLHRCLLHHCLLLVCLPHRC